MHLRYPAAALALALLWTRPSFAGDAALAEALFQEAKQLADSGKFAEACPKFEASYRADRTLGTLLNLANCHEKTNRIATAWAEWNEAIELAKKQGDDRVPYATERRDKLTPRLPKLEVRVTGAAALEVFRGDARIPPGAYNTALPVDPGRHEVSVRRGDAVLERRPLTAEESKTATIELDLDAIERAHPAPKTSGGGAGTGGTAPPQADVRESSSQKTIGFIVGGIGVAALATAGVLEIIAISNKNKADEPDQCVNKYCSPQGLDSADKAKTYADIGQWVGIGGIVVTAVGLTLVLTAPSAAEPERARVDVAPWLGSGSGGLSVKGTL